MARDNGRQRGLFQTTAALLRRAASARGFRPSACHLGWVCRNSDFETATYAWRRAAPPPPTTTNRAQWLGGLSSWISASIDRRRASARPRSGVEAIAANVLVVNSVAALE